MDRKRFIRLSCPSVERDDVGRRKLMSIIEFGSVLMISINKPMNIPYPTSNFLPSFRRKCLQDIFRGTS